MATIFSELQNQAISAPPKCEFTYQKVLYRLFPFPKPLSPKAIRWGPKWGAEDTHAGRWADAGCGSFSGMRREESPGKGTELLWAKRMSKQGLGIKQHATYKGLIN